MRSVRPGSTGTFAVSLSSAPSASVTVSIADENYTSGPTPPSASSPGFSAPETRTDYKNLNLVLRYLNGTDPAPAFNYDRF